MKEEKEVIMRADRGNEEGLAGRNSVDYPYGGVLEEEDENGWGRDRSGALEWSKRKREEIVEWV